MILTRPYSSRKVYPYLLALAFLFSVYPPKTYYLYVLSLVFLDEVYRNLWSVFYEDGIGSFVLCNIIYGCMYSQNIVGFLSFFVFGMFFSVSAKDYSPLEMYLLRATMYLNFLGSST